MRPLFIDETSEDSKTKEAGFTHRLSETPDNWGQEIGSELHRQLPFLSDYEVNVTLDKVDQGRGFAFGYADISNRTERPEVEHEEAGIPHIRVPLIAEERQVRPFSVFLDGERVLPLGEERIRETLFNPGMFDLSTSVPRDPSLVEPLMPPQRSGIGMGGEYKMAMAYPEPASIATNLDYRDEWLRKFVGTALFQKAMELQKQFLSLDQEDLSQREMEQTIEESSGRASQRMAKNLQRDALHLEKRNLDVELLAAQAGVPTSEAPSPHEQGLDASAPEGAMEEAPEEAAPAPKAPKEKKAGIPKGMQELAKGKKFFQMDPYVQRRVAANSMGNAARKQKNHGHKMLDIKDGQVQKKRAKELLEKNAFKHISKEQWEAIYKSDKIQKMIQKHMTHDHPEVINEVYSLAANQYGYHPKVYPPSPGQQAQKAQAANMGGAPKPAAAAPAAKPATKTASLLEAIAPTLRETDRDAFVEKVANDATLRAGFRRSGIASVLVNVMDTKLASARDRMSALADAIEPSVVTFQKLPGGDFLVKSANVQAFAGGEQAQGQVVPFQEVAEAIGTEPARAMQPGQIATAVSDPVKGDSADESEFDSISEFGRYKVQGTDGKEREGWVFPQTFAWDENLTPQKTGLFISDNAHAIQQDFAGARVAAEDINLPTDIPKGLGIFHSKNGDSASAPIEVKFGMTGSDGVPKYVGIDSFGNEVKVSVVPGLKTPQKISEGEYALPHGWGFTRLPSKVSLSEKSDSIGTQSKLKKEKTSAVLFYNGAFNIVGGCGLDKVSADLRHSIDAVGAEFMLGLLGVDGVSAKQKVAEARKIGSVTLTGLKTIVPLAERFQESIKTASALLSKIPNLKRDLIKEASMMEDQGTVDKVLALNFVNPENLTTFIEYLPELERCSENMAEMVLAGYMGMREIPVGAVERSMKNMEEVVQSLKALQYTQE